MNKIDFKKLFHSLLGKSCSWYSQDVSCVNLLWNARPAACMLLKLSPDCFHLYSAQSYQDISCCSSFQPLHAFLWNHLHLPTRTLTVTWDCLVSFICDSGAWGLNVNVKNLVPKELGRNSFVHFVFSQWWAMIWLELKVLFEINVVIFCR